MLQWRWDAGPRPTPIVPGRVQLVIKNNNKVPLEENNNKVMLELTGGDSTGDRSGLDLVAVLDVSGSMQGDKIDKMKTAMQFVIKKLSPIDRLSIVTFSDKADRLCPLRVTNEASKPALKGFIDGLRPGGGTNISVGLSTGLRVLAERKLSQDRVAGVILISDGEQNNGDATKVVIGDVPVHTFGFGANAGARVLNEIAKNSVGGTFCVVNDIKGLSLACSQCLAGLLTVLVQDLKLTLLGLNQSEIKKVDAGSYQQTTDAGAGSVTVSFGDLYIKEVRIVIVHLTLPKITKNRTSFEYLKVKCSYIKSGDPLAKEQEVITKLNVKRKPLPGQDNVKLAPKLETEVARLNMVTMIKAARTMADGKNLDDAREKLAEAQNALEDLVEHASPLVGMLKTDLAQLIELMQEQDVYEKQGRSYALSAETSHDQQRFAARGDIGRMRLFATPRMDKYLEQARRFDQDPAAPLPSVDEDVKEELAANPLAPIAGPITFYIQAAIQALQAIEKLINNGGKP
jgi:uncharacterized protein YegL